MELVDGYTLKQYIEKKSRLTISECISIALPIASGIEAAHNNGIIHRDIKPQNVIISKDGKVKVTDFGIAKTTTSNTISSNVMGSVHYTSPEQARGGFSDEKSDIYSLGITLFEMVTGRVPFNGDTTVAIAIKHIQEEMPSPRIYVEDVPISIEQIILKCTQKSPDRRYQKMSEVIEDLKKAYISPNENFVKIDTYEQNSVTKTNLNPMYRRRGEEEAADVTNPVKEDVSRLNKQKREALVLPKNVKNTDDPVIQNVQRKPKVQPQTANKPQVKPKIAQTQQKPVQTQQKPKPTQTQSKPVQHKNTVKKNSKKKSEASEKIKTVAIAAVAVTIGVLLLILLGKALGIFSDKDEKVQFTTVPVVSNMVSSEAQKYLENHKFTVEITYEDSETVPSNRVIRTEPSAGSNVEEGSKVTMVISAVKDTGVKIPDVVNMTEAEATAKLENDGFKVTKTSEKSDTVPKGKVISQSPEAGSPGSLESLVTLTISDGSGKEKSKMPDLTGKTVEEATELVESVGMKVASVDEIYSDSVEAGLICGQSYTSGSTVKEGSEVTLKKSIGPEPRYYSCNIMVQAPDRYTGGAVSVILKTLDGEKLYHNDAPIFPLNINISQIYAQSRGVVEISYTVMTTEETVDENGNVIVQNVPKPDVISYEVEFD